jgi:hypothetical protein
MQNGGNFVLNKARYLMNIDDADLCVYPKSISEKKKANTELPPGTPPQKKAGKKYLKAYFMMLPGLVASCP